jgi:hypothetical protein
LACAIETFACILVFVVFVLLFFLRPCRLKFKVFDPTFLWIMSVFLTCLLAVVAGRYVVGFRLVTASSVLVLAILCELASEAVVDEV